VLLLGNTTGKKNFGAGRSTGYRKRENEEKRGAVFHREVAMLPVIQLIIK
jgi:hypothetical protein